MKKSRVILVFAACSAAAALRGDDVRAKDHLLCSTVQVMECTPDGECRNQAPGDLNVPEFLEVLLKDKSVVTTKASGENRSSSIRSLFREGGLIVLQGLENGHAFSLVIDEASGLASESVVRNGGAVSIFGLCTPIAEGK
jgi:hypothetical protein